MSERDQKERVRMDVGRYACVCVCVRERERVCVWERISRTT